MEVMFPGRYSEAFMKKFNGRWTGLFYLNNSGSKTHFMNSTSTLTMYEMLFGPALRVQREKHGLVGRRAGLQSDGATINDATGDGSDMRRERWSQQANCRRYLNLNSL